MLVSVNPWSSPLALAIIEGTLYSKQEGAFVSWANMRKSQKISAILLFLVAYGCVNAAAFFLAKRTARTHIAKGDIFARFRKSAKPTAAPTPTPAATPAPTPTPRPLATGRQEYTISSGKEEGPRFTKLILDPIDPKPGQKQTVSVSVTNDEPVTQMQYILKTDTTETSRDLSLSQGTATDGVWSGAWTIEDTYLYMYGAIIKAQSSNGTAIAEPYYR